MREPKKAISVRLNETTIRELNNLCNTKKLTQAAVIAVLIHAAYDSWETEEIENAFEVARISG